MKTWLFTWNPTLWGWDEFLYGCLEMERDIAQIGFSICKWTCGNNRSIRQGDRIFLIRLGREPRGIVASGTALSPVFQGTHWREEKRLAGQPANRVFVSFDAIRPDGPSGMLSMETLRRELPPCHWSSQSSGVELPSPVSAALEAMWTAARFCP